MGLGGPLERPQARWSIEANKVFQVTGPSSNSDITWSDLTGQSKDARLSGASTPTGPADFIPSRPCEHIGSMFTCAPEV
jgi:hypothetical protein